MKVGVIGLGAMGAPMAQRLLDAGHDLVVHNRTTARAEALVRRGSAYAETPADLASAVEVVVSCVLDDAAVEEVHLGPRGVLAGARSGLLVIEHATASPALAVKVHEAYRGQDVAFLDGPVTGGPERAESGQLVAILGGEAPDVARARPVLSAYSSTVVHVGGPGTGMQLKLVNQLLVIVHAAAAAEALALLDRLEIRGEAPAEVLMHGWAASAMLDRALERRGTVDGTATGATTGGLERPAALALELLASRGLDSNQLRAAAALLRQVTAGGHGGDDIGDLARALEERV